MSERLKIKLQNLPSEPGCYLMKNAQGKIIYVGKAKVLRNRVNSYFVGAHAYKVMKMVSQIDDFDYIITASEKEALILELNLIKQHQPRFNVIFMDDKVYPYIKITNEKWPRIVISRNRGSNRKKERIFGPYPESSSAYRIIHLLNSIYPTRKCKTMPNKICLYYHLHQCLGMCEYEVDADEYALIMDRIERILKGDTKSLLDEYQNELTQLVEELRFEKAGEVNKIIEALVHISDRQEVQSNNNDNLDVFNYYIHSGYISIVTIQIRNGKVLNTIKYLNPLYDTPVDALSSYINQYYLTEPVVSAIIIPKEIDSTLFTDNIAERIFVPQRGRKVRYIEMSENNAKQHLDEKFSIMNTLPDKISEANKQLDYILNLDIFRIEMFDISHISGSNTVAGMVVYDEGLPNKDEYRMYRLEDNKGDTESMHEVIYRRYFRLLSENMTLPDLILVDGGIQQINVANEVISSLGLQVNIAGLVKDDFHNTRGLMNSQGVELPVDKESELFFFLTRMQDEVHRFAITYHQKLRSKSQTRSILDDIEGVGPTRKQKLLKTFKSIKNIKSATIDELIEVVPLDVAQNIIEYFAD